MSSDPNDSADGNDLCPVCGSNGPQILIAGRLRCVACHNEFDNQFGAEPDVTLSDVGLGARLILGRFLIAMFWVITCLLLFIYLYMGIKYGDGGYQDIPLIIWNLVFSKIGLVWIIVFFVLRALFASPFDVIKYGQPQPRSEGGWWDGNLWPPSKAWLLSEAERQARRQAERDAGKQAQADLDKERSEHDPE